MSLSEELVWRGFVQQSTFTDIKLVDSLENKVFYHGFDASADSQTIGNLASMMMDRLLIRHGFKAVLLAGGATSLIGDPGGKDKERLLQDVSTVAHNVESTKKQLRQIFEGCDFTLVNNLDWYQDMRVLDFLRDVGKHFSMTPLVQRDYIAKRIGKDGSGISFTEFSYTLLQGYDFLQLYRNYGVVLQLSGSDQWGNIISGVDLIRRVEGVDVHGITMPLVINKSTGRKFGKSEEGAIWLDSKKTSVFKFYQFWLNLDDEGVEGYLKVYTDLTKQEIEDVMAEFNEDRSSRVAQKTLAKEVTRIVHGIDKSKAVVRATEVLFGNRSAAILSDEEVEILSQEITTLEFSTGLVDSIKEAGFASTNSEVMRLMTSGGLQINGKRITTTDETQLHKGYNLFKKGKNTFAIVIVK